MIVDTSHFSFVNIMNSRVVKTLTELSQSKLTKNRCQIKLPLFLELKLGCILLTTYNYYNYYIQFLIQLSLVTFSFYNS